MAGKPKNTWGGKRPNQTGRPKGSGKQTTISERQKQKWLDAAESFAEKNKMTVEEAVLSMIVNKDVQDTVRVAAAKLYVEATTAKESVRAVEITKKTGPTVGLPPLQKDPALTVVGGKQ